MSESSKSIPGKALIEHEAGDTLRRTITLKKDDVAIDLTGATLKVIVSDTEDAAAIATLLVGTGLAASDVANGEIKIFWQTAGVLEPRKTYWYKLVVEFTDGTIKTYLEDKIKTK